MKNLNFIIIGVFLLLILIVLLIIYILFNNTAENKDLLDSDYKNLYINNYDYENIESPGQNDE